MAMFFPCQVCLQSDPNTGECEATATYCVTMRQFNERCKPFDPMCNPLATAWVAASTVCQQRLFANPGVVEVQIDPTGKTNGMATSCDDVPMLPADPGYVLS